MIEEAWVIYQPFNKVHGQSFQHFSDQRALGHWSNQYHQNQGQGEKFSQPKKLLALNIYLVDLVCGLFSNESFFPNRFDIA